MEFRFSLGAHISELSAFAQKSMLESRSLLQWRPRSIPIDLKIHIENYLKFSSKNVAWAKISLRILGGRGSPQISGWVFCLRKPPKPCVETWVPSLFHHRAYGEAVGGHLGASWGVLGHSWVLLGCSWGSLGTLLDAIGRSWGALGSLLGASWTSLGRTLEKTWVRSTCWAPTWRPKSTQVGSKILKKSMWKRH